MKAPLVAAAALAAMVLFGPLAAAEPARLLIPAGPEGDALAAGAEAAAAAAGLAIRIRRAPMAEAVAAFCDVREKKGETADMLLARRGLTNREAKLCYPRAIRDLRSLPLGAAHLTAKKSRLEASPDAAALARALEERAW